MQRSVFGYLSGHPGTDLRRFVKRLIGESMGRRNATRSTKAVPQGQQRPVLTFAEPARSGGLFFSLTSSIASVLNPETQAQEEASGTNSRLFSPVSGACSPRAESPGGSGGSANTKAEDPVSEAAAVQQCEEEAWAKDAEAMPPPAARAGAAAAGTASSMIYVMKSSLDNVASVVSDKRKLSTDDRSAVQPRKFSIFNSKLFLLTSDLCMLVPARLLGSCCFCLTQI